MRITIQNSRTKMLLLAGIPRYSFTPAARWKLQSSDPLVQAHSTTQVVPTTGQWPQKENDLAVFPPQRKGHNNNIVGCRGGGDGGRCFFLFCDHNALQLVGNCNKCLHQKGSWAERTTELIMWFKGCYGNLSRRSPANQSFVQTWKDSKGNDFFGSSVLINKLGTGKWEHKWSSITIWWNFSLLVNEKF